MLKSLCFIFAIFVTQVSCSVYQSDGREFLESKGFDFALQGSSVGLVQANGPCAQVKDLPELFFETEGFMWVDEIEDADFWAFYSDDGRVSLSAHFEKFEEESTQIFVCEKVYADEVMFSDSFDRDSQLFLEAISKLM